MRIAFLLLVLACGHSHATFSIIACEPGRGNCGAAVATDNLAVGASVIYARAGIGALTSQFETHPLHGRVGLIWLEASGDPKAVLKQLLVNDDGFEGGSEKDRQLAIVSAKGKTACHTGDNATKAEYAGCLTDGFVSVQGNGLASEAVITAMHSAFRDTSGSLAHRLVSALEAGQAAGGQRSGTMSAAVYVSTPDGFPFDVDLRVDASANPVSKLRYLYDLFAARQHVINARRLVSTSPDIAEAQLLLAIERGGSWDRVVRRAIEVAELLEQPTLVSDLKRKLHELGSLPGTGN